MLPTSSVAHFLEHTSPEIRDIILELRNLIASVAPNAAEVRHSRGFSYYDDQRGGTVSAGICQIVIFEDHIHLAFIHGAFLPDPKGMLIGEAKFKKYVPITSFRDAPWDYLGNLITASTHFDSRTLSINQGS